MELINVDQVMDNKEATACAFLELHEQMKSGMTLIGF